MSRQHGGRRSSTLASRLVKSFRIVTCVLTSFLLTNMPWQVVENMIVTGATNLQSTDPLYVLFWILSYMNAFLNPLFYCFMNKGYRLALMRRLRCGNRQSTGTGLQHQHRRHQQQRQRQHLQLHQLSSGSGGNGQQLLRSRMLARGSAP